MLATDFGIRLRAARELRGLTQIKLAELTDLPPTSISHFEAGRRLPCAQNLRELAFALEADANWLLCLRTEPAAHLQSTKLAKEIDAMTVHDRRFLRGVIDLFREGVTRDE